MPLIDPVPSQCHIMVVDDNPANLKLLEDMLTQQGYEVCSFPLGRLALAAAARNPPDLILLDINMPEMNGYEVCERLKSSARLADIPVIFLSALNETQDKVKAFQSGAVDYISKPFQFEEVHARVETHLQLHGLQRALKMQNQRLEEAVAARTRELTEANQRLSILDGSKNEFLGLISHEFRTPLNGLLGVGELIFDELDQNEENNRLREMFQISRRRILSILDDALLLTHIDVKAAEFASEPVSLSEALGRCLTNTTEFAKSRGVALAAPGEDPGLVRGDADLLVRALDALLETAVRFSDQGSSVRISRQELPAATLLLIESRGKTIPGSVMEKFFEVFSIGEAATAGGDMGLRPALAHRILSLFGASVSVANRELSGIRLTISLQNFAATSESRDSHTRPEEHDPDRAERSNSRRGPQCPPIHEIRRAE